MGRKAKISKEMILEAAFELLDESGIGAVAIKNIAAKLDCSTQPVSWQFGSMAELKKELFIYSARRMWGDLESKMEGKDAIDAFFVSGVQYISIACDHPNVFRFLNIDDPMQTIGATGAEVLGENSIFTQQMNAMSVEALIKQYKIPKKKIGDLVQNMVIYTHGLSVMMMWDNYRLPKEKAIRMMFDMGIKLLSETGIDVSDRKWSKKYANM